MFEEIASGSEGQKKFEARINADLDDIVSKIRSDFPKLKDDDIRFIVKAVDNATDPISIINIFRFETNKKKRLAELASVSTFGSVKSNKLERLRFSAEKYGEKSYLLTLIDKPAGEYGITVSNPNSLDEKGTIVSTFAIE